MFLLVMLVALLFTVFPYTTLFRSSATAFGANAIVCFAYSWDRMPRPSAIAGASCSRTRRQGTRSASRSEEHTSELQSLTNLVCRLLLEKKKTKPDCGWGRIPGHGN